MSALSVLWLVIVAWLPGAVIFRAPVAERERRAALDADERAFWAVIISVTVSLSVTLALAGLGRYTFGRLLAIDVALSVAIAAAAKLRLRLGPDAARPRLHALVPILLVLAGGWRFLPPAEYVMGGKDPGTYMNEGIQIAQRGSLVTYDETIASVPPAVRDLFFPSHANPNYYSLRFMGFYIRDPESGLVVGQFPHLFPASIAIGYGVDGLTGARRVTAFWAVLGVLAVYFAGARLVGRPAAAAAAALLLSHVLQVWYARYPSSEVVMQALLFAAVLAADRALVEADRFFMPLAGVLLGLQLWLRFDIVLAIAAVTAVIAIRVALRRPLPWRLLLPMILVGGAALVYLVTLMSGYSYYPIAFTRDWLMLPLAAAVTIAVAGLLWIRRAPGRIARFERLVPVAIAAVGVAAVVYGWIGRVPAGRTAAHDAYALRTFVQVYMTVPGMIAALAGFAYLTVRHFWRAPALLLTLATYSAFFFYKIRVVPEHFWMGRRFLAVILPGALLSAASIALYRLDRRARGRAAVAAVLGVLFLVLLGAEYARVARPVVAHVEYAGIIPKLEALAARFGDDDLVVVESRDASDLHVLALPLAYIYARHVLLLTNPVPDKQAFAAFLGWAHTRYNGLYFLGSGGTDLLSRAWTLRPVASEQFTVPEYDATPWHAFPRGPRSKEFDYGLYAFGPPATTIAGVFDLDLGMGDDLHVVRFHSKEQTEGRWMRWTGRTSYISLTPLAPDVRTLTMWMSDGGRPASAAPAEVEVYFQDQLVGKATVTSGFRPYSFALPPALVIEASATDASRLRLVSTVWNPHALLGLSDDRDLGVMVDRVRLQ